jgi:D-glycero-D-manno-heptose 1,7-bisphosphate phosphatase
LKGRTEAAAVFLDRDGTILRDVGYLSRQEQIEILPRVPEAIRLLKKKGYKIVVVTNQSAGAYRKSN